MLKDFFIHASFVITFLFIGGSLFKSNPNVDTTVQKLKLGALAGILGSVLMAFSIQITPVIMMDLRHIAILLSAFYGGFVSAILAATIININRLVFFDISTETFLVTMLIMFSIGAFASLVEKRLNGSGFLKWTVMGLISLLTISIGLLYLMGFTNQVYQLLVNYWVITTIAGMLVYFLTGYIVQSNQLFMQLKTQSATDFLTGLNNVRQFDSSLNESIESAQELNERLSLLMIDIDHFKKVNDTYGHQAGDEVLRQLGGLLISCSRPSDIVSRNGGEEFSLLLKNCSYSRALEIAERLRGIVENHRFSLPNGKEINITISLGASTYLETTQCLEEFIKQADDTLYKSKRTGRNKVSAL
ncbi:diguanylate cyclase [Mesobacillus subterraneus]|uniref:GGDEF domain-containing protein n=1 Tax=Mesobacillus subterraneus TaxID=285983 RepID=UPI001CFC9115|nr:diguanylate cyclase [Mesobacillus subterraneus]WLR54517.1 diguanylate cyclase [Mesobacillus subterraneus]